MKLLKAALAATAVSAFAMSAQAQDSGAYGTLGGQYISIGDGDFINVAARLGYNFGEYFGAEVEGSLGIDGESGSDGEFSASVDIETSFSGYLVARYPVADQFEIFGRVGYHTTSVEFSEEGPGFDDSDTESFDGIAFGGGAQYNFNQKNGIRLGYTNLDADGGSADVFDIAYVRKF